MFFRDSGYISCVRFKRSWWKGIYLVLVYIFECSKSTVICDYVCKHECILEFERIASKYDIYDAIVLYLIWLHSWTLHTDSGIDVRSTVHKQQQTHTQKYNNCMHVVYCNFPSLLNDD